MPGTPTERDTTQVPLIISSDEISEQNNTSLSATAVPINAPTNLNNDVPPPWQDIFKKEFEQSWPLMLRGAVVAGRYFAISVMLGKVDERLLAPNTLINALETVYITFGGGALGIVSSMISKANGENKKAEIGVLYRQALVFATLLSILPSLLYYFANHHLLTLFGQHPAAVEKAKNYFQSAALGYLPLMLLTAEQRLLQGLQRPVPVLMSNVLHSGLSVACSYLFLFGKLGAPKLEMEGIGYAFSIAGWVSLIVNTIYLLCSNSLRDYQITHMKWDLTNNDFKEMIKKGLPAGLQATTDNIANMINSIFLGLHNLTALAADQMASQIALLIGIANRGLGQAVSVCIGKSLGEKNYAAIKRYGNAGILSGMLFPAVALLFFIFMREKFIGIYIDTKNPENAELVKLASLFLLFEPLRQFTTGVQSTAAAGLLGLKDTGFTAQMSIFFSLILNAAILCLMHFAFHLNSLALFTAKTIGVGIAAFFNTGRWLLLSHEQSDQDKADAKKLSLCQRTSRSFGLFCNQSPRHDISDLSRAEAAASAAI